MKMNEYCGQQVKLDDVGWYELYEKRNEFEQVLWRHLFQQQVFLEKQGTVDLGQKR